MVRKFKPILNDIISRFDRPLTLISDFNIVYFTLNILGSADKNVSEFLTRHPIILLVAPEKEPNDYVCDMLYRAAEDAKIQVNVVQKYTADGALKFMKALPPGRKVSMMLCQYEVKLLFFKLIFLRDFLQ